MCMGPEVEARGTRPHRFQPARFGHQQRPALNSSCSLGSVASLFDKRRPSRSHRSLASVGSCGAFFSRSKLRQWDPLWLCCAGSPCSFILSTGVGQPVPRLASSFSCLWQVGQGVMPTVRMDEGRDGGQRLRPILAPSARAGDH